MNEDQQGKDRQQADQDVIGELIRQAGRRENPTTEEHDRVFAAASGALAAKIRGRQRRFATVGVAATVVVGILVATIASNLMTSSTEVVARLDRVIGPIEITGTDGSNWRPVSGSDTEMLPDVSLRTGPGSRLGLVMHNGVSLRLAEATEVRFVSPGTVELIRGKVYADAGLKNGEVRAGDPSIVIETGARRTWDVGTQFEVLYANDLYRLRVREGQVYLRRQGSELTGEAGDELTIDASQVVRLDRITDDDPAWRWTESVAPDPVIDSRSVSSLLAWVSRQTGRDVAFADPELMLKAETTMLYGSVHFVEPLEALETMLATTDFNYTLLEDGTILVDLR